MAAKGKSKTLRAPTEKPVVIKAAPPKVSEVPASKPPETLEQPAAPVADPVVPPNAPIPEVAEVPTEKQIADAEAEIEAAKARLWALQHPVIPYPKWVKGIVVDSPDEEAAVLAGTAKTEEIKQAGNTQTVIVKGK